MGVYSRPLCRVSNPITNILWWYVLFIYGGLCPICFSRELGFGGSIFAPKFHIFNKLILEEYVYQVEGGPHLFQSCFHAARDNLPLATKKIHPSFESLAVINAPSLHASLMDIHHNTSFKPILEDDSIFSISKSTSTFVQARGHGYGWLLGHLFYLFCIAYFTFTSTMCFCFSLI